MSRASAPDEQPWDWTPTTLALYDPLVIGFSNRFTWRCPTPRILDLYDRHITGNHLDVGVGTGWYIHRCRFPTAEVRLGLMDISRDSLRKAARRLQRFRPDVYQADILRPFDVEIRPYRSISLSYLLHCLPGTMREKSVALDHLKSVLEPGGVLFGATLLSPGPDCSAAAVRLMKRFNASGMFSNADDTPATLRRELESRFDQVEIRTVGCAALFSARA